MKKIALHWQIMIGMVLGVLFGYLMRNVGGEQFISDWIAPFGNIFISLLKLIAIPLIVASLIKGIADLKDISKFSAIGGRTIITYILTTIVAIIIGLVFVNVAQPGNNIAPETVTELTAKYQNDPGVIAKMATAENQKSTGPLAFLEDMVPDNFITAAGDNRNMLQVIMFTILFGISLLLIPEEKSRGIKSFFDGLNEVIMKMVDLIMLIAPFAVFALLANIIISTEDPEVIKALGKYAIVVVVGLLSMIIFYLILVATVVKRNPLWFLKGISPAQLLAFSTSSSAATLPVTMERVTEHLGVDDEVASFVCPVGATINMDGTSLYQGVAAVFIAQALGIDLSLADMLTIVLTALLASIGSAAVPGAGMVMLVAVLEAIGIPPDKLAVGLALIFAVDRPLDMCRTIVNVTGDATVSMLVAKSVGKLGDPEIKNWDDNLEKVI